MNGFGEDFGTWDKKLAAELRNLYIGPEQIGFIIGIVAEQRQIADLQGYKRGFNDGYADGCRKALKGLKE